MDRLTIGQVWRRARRKLRYTLHPRAWMWRHWQKVDPSKPIITRLDDGLRVRVYPHDIIGRYIFIEGVFLPAEWDFVKRYLKAGMTVLDLGANLGQYTLLAAKCVGPTGCVHSFEPSARMFEELEFNVSLNGLSETCILNNVAVSETSGTAALSVYERGQEVFGSLGVTRREEGMIVGHEQVKTIRLDDYVVEQGLGRVDFMKIDIEGAELLALRGAENLLAGPHAPTILIEMADVNTKGFGYGAVEIWDYLVGSGYQMCALGATRGELEALDHPPVFSSDTNLVAVKVGNPVARRSPCQVRR